jgi:ketosteroid isomerase-like protein
MVSEVRDGRLTSACEFEVDDEETAFAYAEERVRATSSRLAVTNRASETTEAGWRAMRGHDLDGLVARYSDRFEYDDQRRLSGGPRDTPAALRLAAARILEQYPHFEWRRLAVRGERLELDTSRWWDEAGNETTALHVFEIGDDGRIIYDGRFDEDNFEGAYRELDRRYYAGEGAAFAEAGGVSTDWMTAANRSDFDRFGELITPEARVENRSRSGLPDRSAAEFCSSLTELNAMMSSVRTWLSAVCWVAPAWCVTRFEREAVGDDGEQYAWTRLLVNEVRDGRLASMCEFEVEDEDAPFVYAEERVRAAASRLAVANRASEIVEAGFLAMRSHDIDGLVAVYSDRFDYDDRRRLSGDPIDSPAALRVAAARILEQYPNMECRILAVRGERLEMHWSRWSDGAGNETTYLHVVEIGDDGRITYDGRFDEDDLEGAYRELERRYHAGEGAASAAAGSVGMEWLIALNRGDFDRVFGELTDPEMRVENRSSSVFPDRSAAELRASLEELNTMVASARSWNSAECWLNSTCGVVRHERQALGLDGEQYAWTRLFVFEARDGRCTALCEFELDEEAAAFAYAEERIRATKGH